VDVTQPALGAIAAAAATALTQDAVYDMFKMGWNLGNQMDANSNGVASETVWGNKKATQATFNGVKAAGYSSVRIPVTYLGHIGDGPAYVLDSKWIDRVAEIVGYA
jgi:aryl-phospho-beta-D-glucosidase BglC (GH1 family)